MEIPFSNGKHVFCGLIELRAANDIHGVEQIKRKMTDATVYVSICKSCFNCSFNLLSNLQILRFVVPRVPTML